MIDRQFSHWYQLFKQSPCSNHHQWQCGLLPLLLVLLLLWRQLGHYCQQRCFPQRNVVPDLCRKMDENADSSNFYSWERKLRPSFQQKGTPMRCNGNDFYIIFCVVSGIVGGIVGGVTLHGLCFACLFWFVVRKITGGDSMIMTIQVNTVSARDSNGKKCQLSAADGFFNILPTGQTFCGMLVTCHHYFQPRF